MARPQPKYRTKYIDWREVRAGLIGGLLLFILTAVLNQVSDFPAFVWCWVGVHIFGAPTVYCVGLLNTY